MSHATKNKPKTGRALVRIGSGASVRCRSPEDWNDLADLYECAADMVAEMTEHHTRAACAHAEKHLRRLAMRATAKGN